MTDAPTPNPEMAPPVGDPVAAPVETVAPAATETPKKAGRGKFAGFVAGAGVLGLLIGLGVGWLGFGDDGRDHGRRPEAQQLQGRNQNQGQRGHQQMPQGNMPGGRGSQNQQAPQSGQQAPNAQNNQTPGQQANPMPNGPQGGQSYGGRSRAS